MKKLTEKLVQFFPYLIAIAFSIKATREPDIWWQIRTGEWILENGQVPKTDMFSNSVAGTEWINIKWGFEVLAAWITKLFGPECVFILQILVSIGIVFFLKKIVSLFNLKSVAASALALFITFAFIEYRIVGRPEMTTHFLFVLYLFILFNHFKNPTSKFIWVLIPLQIFWTNMHEAYGLGIVLIGIFFFAAWVDTFRNKASRPKVISAILGLSILAVLVNPRGVVMLLRPFNIFSQVHQNKFTTELANVFDPLFWQKESYFLVFSIALIVWVFFKNRSKLLERLSSFKLQLVSLLLFGAFIFLSLSASRNIIFYVLLVAPLLAFIIDFYFPKKIIQPTVALVIGLAFYIGIVSNGYYKIVNSRNEYGLFIHPGYNPIGASNFIQKNGLADKKCFSSYMVSSFFLWDLQPDFKTYIDLRDLDVFSSEFFVKYFEDAQVPDKFAALDKKENFEYVALFRRFSPQLHHYLYTDTIYGCVYADPVCAIYQKTDSLAQGDHFKNLSAKATSDFAVIISKLFNPLYTEPDYTEMDVSLQAAEYYQSVGMITAAKQRVNLYLYNHPNDASALELQKTLNTFTPK